jgi:hypothetical protein
MMKLSDASRFFDLTAVTDAETGSLLFKCQIDPYDDSRRDSTSAYRRVMSVRPGTVIPASRVVRAMGRVWIIGSVSSDGLQEMHRDKYVVHPAQAKVKVSRLSDSLAGIVASTVWSSEAWAKDAKQLDTSSDTPQIFDITLPGGTAVWHHDVLWRDGAMFHVQSAHMQPSGFLEATCLKLDNDAPVPATVSSRIYDPVAGGYSVSATVSVNALLVRWQSLFKYGSQATQRYQEGDVSIVLPSGTFITTSSLVTVGGVAYTSLATQDAAGAVVVHARAT